ncbi:type II 3-dehydroquinate dehydratase [Agromyces bracchium]|uniref:3-dehydroquinate dehydratase n=1 Tax=Agromyces bracchium TaxID=88376 RepID=A0A6I3M7X4_9MICO|nr:type II 3-dehydroquinate dehydratase [Agromyces bracchium]MTH69071.1 type II 3-dehydroquinate dehydratase [Agromyces bracchium]
MTTILVLNGPNLGRLGTREPEVYGSETLADIGASLRASVPDEVEIDLRQTDDEGELIGWIHEAVDRRLPVVLNPAAFTHYSYALRDAAAQLTTAGVPLVEVHLSNPHAREAFRHTSVISGVASGVIAGFGAESYRLAVDWLLRAALRSPS